MNQSRMGCGLWLIVIGLIFLLINLGIWDWTIWLSFFEFWPILLVLLGLHILFRRTSYWFIPVVVALLFVAIVGTFGSSLRNFDWLYEGEFSYDVGPNVTRVDVVVNAGAVKLAMYAGEERVVSGSFITGAAFEPEVRYHEVGSRADVRLSTVRDPFWNWIFRKSALEWNVALPTGVPTTLTVNGGAGDFDLDLRGVDVRNVTINGGVGNFVLRFDETGGHTRVDISAGLSNLEVFVPEGVGLRIRVDGVGADTNFAAAGLTRVAGWWQTPNYEESARTVEIDANAALGKVRVVRSR